MKRGNKSREKVNKLKKKKINNEMKLNESN